MRWNMKAMVERRKRDSGVISYGAPRVGAGRGRPRSQEADRFIIDATLAMLAEAGVSAFTVGAVAQRAGVGKATIYRRWSSKLPLIVNAIMTLPELQTPDTGTLRGDLRQILRQLATILRASPLGRVLPHLLSEQGADLEIDEAVNRYLAVRRVPIETALTRGMERGEIPSGIDPHTLTDCFVGPITNRVFFSRQPIEGTFIDFVIRTVLDGLTAPAPRASKAGRKRQRRLRS